MTFRSLGFFASSGVVAAPGMVLLTPTSITHSGTSASIGANGQVTFTAVTSLSLNGVFSADFDNYVVSWRGSVNQDRPGLLIRYRASGTDATGTNYVRQFIVADSTTVSAQRVTSQTVADIGAPDNDVNANGETVFIYGPYLSQPTAWRNIGVSTHLSARIFDFAGTHSLSTSYDGFTILPGLGGATMTGALQVYGVRS